MRTWVGLVLLLGLVACGQPPRAATPKAIEQLPVTASQAPGAGPGAWASFPVHRTPRPIVLLDPGPVMAGFTTGEAKTAAESGTYELRDRLPAAPPTVTAQLPDGPAEFRTLPAEAALTKLRAVRGAPEPAHALPILRVELGTAEFGTDRGRITLPAWLFHAADALGPIAWPALPEEAFWTHETPPGMGLGDSRLNPDGTLTVPLPAPAPPCPGEQPVHFEPVVAETAATVSVTVRSDSPLPRGDCARDLMLRYEERTVQLVAPLGNRVLIDEKGAPIPVIR